MARVTTLAVWGATPPAQWVTWFQWMRDASNELGSTITHFGIKGSRFSGKQIRLVSDFNNLGLTQQSDDVEWLSGYSLPRDFQTAAFDYDIHMARSRSYVALSAKNHYSKPLLANTQTWISQMRRFCSLQKGELFELDSSDVPMLYITQSVQRESLSSFKLLEEFTDDSFAAPSE